MANARGNEPEIAEVRRPSWLSRAFVMLAGFYLAGLWLEGIGSSLTTKLLPPPITYFLQVARLFPKAARMSIDYRAEAWLCEKEAWAEIDVRPYFPIDADHKENRFHRALYFYRRERRTMQALEQYIVNRHNEAIALEGGSSVEPEVGGVRFSSLRIPLPMPGDTIERFSRRPLSFYPEDQRRDWYWTPMSKRAERCKARTN